MRTFESLVSEEVDLVELPLLDVVQAVRLVPARGEHVEADLAADAELQVQVTELLLNRFNHIFTDVVSLSIEGT